MVGEAPGSDEGALQLWERAADGHRVRPLAQRDQLGRKVLDVRRRVGVVLAVDELGCGFDVAHGRSFVRALHATRGGGAVGRNGGAIGGGAGAVGSTNDRAPRASSGHTPSAWQFDGVSCQRWWVSVGAV